MHQHAFDVGEFTRTARGSLRDELDLSSIAAIHVTPDVLLVLEALRDLEGATMAHLRNVLVTPTHKDARVTAFLVTWAFEKFWIADAIGAIVEATDANQRSRMGTDAAAAARGIRRVRGPLRRSLAGFTQGESIVGAHATIGLVDDWILEGVYERISSDPDVGGPVTAALDAVLVVKARHTAFFEQEARRRLAASRRAARLARHELRRSRWPLGDAAIDAAHRRAVVRLAWSGTDGAERLASLEGRIAELPGLGASAASAVGARLAQGTSD
jgi:hypothetical protein